MVDALKTKPLKERPGDWFFVVAFGIFIVTSFTADILSALDVTTSADSDCFWIRKIHWYGENIDPLMRDNPLFFQVITIFTTFVFGPFYFFLVYAFVRGRNWIRIPAIMYVSAITFSTIIVFGVSFFGDRNPGSYPMYLAIYMPYIVVPLLLGYRMRRPNPFN